jgi:hypothetical protein
MKIQQSLIVMIEQNPQIYHIQDGYFILYSIAQHILYSNALNQSSVSLTS